MRKLVAKPVRVKVSDAGLIAPPLHHLAYPAVSHWPKAAKPQRVSCCGEGMFCPGPDVAAKCLACPVAKRSSTLAPALSQNERNVLVKVQMAHLDSSQLGNSQS